MDVLSPWRFRWSRQTSGILLLLFSGVTAVAVSCRSSHEVTQTVATRPQPARRADPYLAPGFPRGNNAFHQASYRAVGAPIPVLEGAEYVNDDELCAQCHEGFHKSFLAQNVHRNESCEACHGPASRHLETRGREPGLIFSFKSASPVVAAEMCLKCHEEHQCSAGAQWRTSVHANRGVTCVSCHRGHYDVPAGTPATSSPGGDAHVAPQPTPPLAALPAAAPGGVSQLGALMRTAIPPAPRQQPAQVVPTPYPSSQVAVLPAVPSQTTPASPPAPPANTVQPLPGVSLVNYVAARSKQDVQGYERPTRNLPSLAGMSQNMGAVAPGVCFQCHNDMRDLQHIAGPHQIGGPNGFNCTTCHNPHGQILQHTRKDLCLQCHQGTPTMAWHASIHNLAGVACTDCHNPHPRGQVQSLVNITHTQIQRPKRMPMSVSDPEACYKCHQKIYGLNSLPSHHPVFEGKMTCSSCHDAHGQYERHLRDATVNLVCYRCHADKQGPFAYEHPPVTENCAICHEPHGTVANNLLRQPATFLCLRCHTGHRFGPPGPNHIPLMGDVGTSPASQAAFYTDCTQCHQQIHGSDLPSPHLPNAKLR